jgi:hypothetical protein
MKHVPLFIFVFISVFNLKAEDRYALLIGINNYIKPDSSRSEIIVRPAISDLPACENNVAMMKQLLIGKYGFSQINIQSIMNQHAKRDSILQALNTALNQCDKGDAFFFYFSGHGSQLINKLSKEPDLKDETIVPADGVYKNKDIRDKELAKIFQRFLDKGVSVTAVFQCCHSGSIARGLGFNEERIEASGEIIEDGASYPEPEKNGALIFSASQDFQVSLARKWSNGNWYSDFTKAFVEVAKKSTPQTSAQNLYAATVLQLKEYGASQVPALAANAERRNAPLFGQDQSVESPFSILVEKVLADKSLLLQGGTAMGLERGTELENAGKTIKIEITGDPDLTKSTAKIILGDVMAIKTGSSFFVSRYAYSGENKLQVCIPDAKMSREVFYGFKTQLTSFLAAKNMRITHSPDADYGLYFNNAKWYLNDGTSERCLDTTLNFDMLSSIIQNGKSIRLQLPVYAELHGQITSLLIRQYSCVNISELGNSDYFLSGTLAGDQLNYTLVKTQEDSSSSSVFPQQSAAITMDTTQENRIASEVCNNLWKLSRIKSWLNLEGDDSGESFPYDVSLKNLSTGQMMGGGVVKEEEKYQLYFVKTSSVPADKIKKRWVYVFVLQSDGSIQLLFPEPDRGNIENFLPIDPSREEERMFAGTINVNPPFGIDNIICLTSSEQLTNPAMIAQEGITTKSANQNALELLITSMNTQTRSAASVKAPETWSVQKIRFRSVPK